MSKNQASMPAPSSLKLDSLSSTSGDEDDIHYPSYSTSGDEDDILYPGYYGDFAHGRGPNMTKPNPTASRHKKNKKGSRSKKNKRQSQSQSQAKNSETENGIGMKLNYVEQDDGPIKFSLKDLLTVEEAWGICLIGYFDGKFPGKQAFLQLRNEWNVKTRLRNHKGWYIFNFDSKDDMNKVLSGDTYYAYGVPLRLQPMPSLFRFEKPKITNAGEWLV